jgi:ketosteroid isomerase-like protein
LRAVDDLVVEDFVLTSSGADVTGRDAFKAWIEAFQAKAKNVRLQAFETFANADATRVTSRWQATGINNGVLGTEPDGRPISFTGIAIWEIRWTADGPKLAHNWVERSAWELYQQLTAPAADQGPSRRH